MRQFLTEYYRRTGMHVITTIFSGTYSGYTRRHHASSVPLMLQWCRRVFSRRYSASVTSRAAGSNRLAVGMNGRKVRPAVRHRAHIFTIMVMRARDITGTSMRFDYRHILLGQCTRYPLASSIDFLRASRH